MSVTNRAMIFRISCIALTVTSMTFAIRAGMLTQLGLEFGLTATELGWVASMAFFGFPAATFLGGVIYNSVGPRRILIAACLAHLIGFFLTIASTGFWGLMASTFLVGFANGAVEAACNPLIARLYPDNRTTMLNRFHVWFPGGIVIGSLVVLIIQYLGAQLGVTSTWQIEIAAMVPGALIYGFLIFRTSWPEVAREESTAAETLRNAKALLTPLFLVICVLMTVTATVELGTQQWVGPLLSASGAQPLMVLALVTGLMAIGRYFAGALVHRLGSPGVLLISAAFSALGIAGLSVATGWQVYLAAIIFAIGVCYFWPTMLGFVSENVEQSGALGLSIVGGVGMLGLALWQPVIGSWFDSGMASAEAAGLAGASAELVAGQQVLQNLLILPIGLIVAFSLVWLWIRKREGM